ncbi:aldehyde dehydrogenase [Nocardioides sp. NPDC023903]|uniref:aldehyde dehydrogenase n=1 Tax=Nocardioides sp. NPDC023903 TaxID=3157195 RepID=UPI0033C56859
MVWQGRSDLFIDGTWVSGSGEALDVVSPTTEEVLARFKAGSPADIDAAVTAARRAFDDGPWARTSLEERVALIIELRRLLQEEQESSAQLMTDEMGCPITQSRTILAGAPLDIIDAYLDVARDFPFQEIRSARTGRALVSHEPVGVVAAIVPWNSPLGISVQKVVPALLAGCTVVLKPAPQTALTGFLFAELIERAGFPPGVVNVVPADREASEALVVHPGVDKVTFTGSTAAGRRIASLCGHDLRRVSLELGGKSAALVLDDADLDQTVEALRMGAFRNSGQVCTLKTRVLVPERHRDELVGRLEAMVASLSVGDPHDEETQIGPMVTEAQLRRVEGYIAAGCEQGAKLVTGGGRPAGQPRGWFVEPTLFSDVGPNMSIAREEIFGPVLSVLSYADERDAVAIANDTSYGLSGAVFSTDVERGLTIARQLRTGAVELNGSAIGLGAPFGGFKESGLGRENGPEGLSAYTEMRSIGLAPDVEIAL